jgi:hypothetical protein
MSDYRARVDFGEQTWWPELSQAETEELKRHKPNCHYRIWLQGDDRSYNGVCDCGAEKKPGIPRIDPKH